MKAILLSLLFLGILGCNSPVPNELNSKAELLAAIPLTREVIQKYASQLAAITHIPISSVISRRDGRREGLPIIELSTTDNRDIVVTITGEASINAMFVTVSGKIETVRAKSLASAAKSLFIQMYPAGQFTAFERKGGLLGP